MGLGATAVIGYQDENGNWTPVTSGKGLPVSGGGGGAVESVNGQTGEVVLTGGDIEVDTLYGVPLDLQTSSDTTITAITKLDVAVLFFDGYIGDRPLWRTHTSALHDEYDQFFDSPLLGQLLALFVGGTAEDLPEEFNPDRHVHISQEVLDGGGGGAVSSVNGKTGEVEITGDDIEVEPVAGGQTHLVTINTAINDLKSINNLFLNNVNDAISQVLYFNGGSWFLTNGHDLTGLWEDLALAGPILFAGGTTNDLPPIFDPEEHIHISQEVLDGGGGGGAVESVNGQTGEVEITGNDLQISYTNTNLEFVTTSFYGFVDDAVQGLIGTVEPVMVSHQDRIGALEAQVSTLEARIEALENPDPED